MKYFLFTLISIFAVSKTFAQESSWGVSAVKAGWINPTSQFQIQGPGSAINYKPSPQTTYALGLNFGPIATFIGFGTASSSDQDTYGSTNISSFDLRFNGYVHNLDFNYKNYDGLYIDNSTEVDPSWTSSRKIQRPDISYEQMRFKYMYTGMPEYFQVGVFDQTVFPKQSGASWLAGAQLYRQNFSGSLPVIPAAQIAAYQNMGGLKDATMTSAMVGVGGGFNVVWNYFYVAGLVYYSIGPQWQDIDYVSKSEKATKTGTELNLKATFGLKFENFFTALNLSEDQDWVDLSDGKFNTTDRNLAVWLGWMF